MDSALLNIALLGIAVAVLPGPIIIALLILQGNGGLAKQALSWAPLWPCASSRASSLAS